MIRDELFLGPLPKEAYDQVINEFHLFRQDRTVEFMARALYGQKMARRALNGITEELTTTRNKLRARNIDEKSGVLTNDAWKEEVEHSIISFSLGRRLSDNNDCALLIRFDAENFKEINDTKGHAEGDRAIGVIGDYLRSQARIEAGDLVGRLGSGDEFGWFVPFDSTKVSPLKVLKSIEGRLLDFAPEQFPGMPTLRWNHAVYSEGMTINNLLKVADVKGEGVAPKVRSHSRTDDHNKRAFRLALTPLLIC
ncbi:diguanylate cyclase [Candidatus Saccharibacteria bacterium]|nr:diguanylate cyclase [Candidatus Saccharibacteria bacterium]